MNVLLSFFVEQSLSVVDSGTRQCSLIITKCKTLNRFSAILASCLSVIIENLPSEIDEKCSRRSTFAKACVLHYDESQTANDKERPFLVVLNSLSNRCLLRNAEQL